MISFKRISSDEYEGPLTPDKPLISKHGEEDCLRTSPRPFALAFRSSKVFIAFVICMAVFTDAFLYTLVIPCLPDMLTKKSGVRPEDVQKWTSILLSIFGAANLIVSPLAGIMADWTKTRRTPLLLGLLALTASTVLYCFGRTPLILVLARGLQGASAAAIWVVGLALLSDTMGTTHAGGAMGWLAIGRFSGMVLGPSFGGIVYDVWGHYAVFAMAFSVLLFDIILRFVMVERKVAERWIPDPKQLGYGTIETCEPLSQATTISEAPLSRTDTFKRGASLSTKTSAAETPAEDIPWWGCLMRSMRILMALWSYFVCSIIMTALESILSLYTMGLFNWSVAKSGLIFIMPSLAIIIDPWLGRLTDKHGCRELSVCGLFLGVITWIGLSFATSNTIFSIAIMSFFLFLLGFSVALTITPNMAEISHAVEHLSKSSENIGTEPATVMGRAYSLLNMSWGIGSVVGPLWGGAVIEFSGWIAVCSSFVVLQFITAGLAWRFAGERVSEKEGE